MNNIVNTTNQNIYLEDRKKLNITGVEHVDKFNESCIVIVTTNGVVTIKGEVLNISKLNLDDANVKIEGHIDSMVYSNKSINHKKGLLKNMFK
ncbi:sporulation protein YabP [Abyssisolibacter fermentans]|uniref:sporulation protein YabP n=1 Tax=Abyssisolibacter fermentans TaxID=1766203 RepID=UPI00082E0889|nr:sporulation protein YabP [Abyssisolibacter fermentans]